MALRATGCADRYSGRVETDSSQLRTRQNPQKTNATNSPNTAKVRQATLSSGREPRADRPALRPSVPCPTLPTTKRAACSAAGNLHELLMLVGYSLVSALCQISSSSPFMFKGLCFLTSVHQHFDSPYVFEKAVCLAPEIQYRGTCFVSLVDSCKPVGSITERVMRASSE